MLLRNALPALLSGAVVAGALIAPLGASAQYSHHYSHSTHERAKYAQRRSDHHHHTGVKVIGGSAAGGAVIGALAGGGKGALIGGAIGAGGGAIANKARENHDIHKREETGRY